MDVSDVEIFSWGANSYGQLGCGDFLDRLEPTQLRECPKRITGISGGGGHTMVITHDGQLMSCGNNENGQLGTGTTDPSDTLVLNDSISDICQVACGWNFTLALSNDGTLWACGSNTYGQLGVPDAKGNCKIFRKVAIEEKVVYVAAGVRHAAALTESGNLWMWGENTKSQLAAQSKIPITKPSQVQLLEGLKLSKISCGLYHTLALSDTGCVYGWGGNSKGQLAHPLSSNPILTSVTRLPLENVKSLVCGWTHSAALLETGEVVTWGRKDYGQLGRIGVSNEQGHIPAVVESLRGIVQLSCGSEHNVAVAKDGQLWSWGWNEHGMCGNGTETNVLSPVAVPKSKNVVHAAAGAGFSIAVRCRV